MEKSINVVAPPGLRLRRDGRENPKKHVISGGSWNNNANNCRVSNHNENKPDNRNNNYGFRHLQHRLICPNVRFWGVSWDRPHSPNPLTTSRKLSNPASKFSKIS